MTILERSFGQTNYLVRYQVHDPQDGMRLDQFIQVHMPGFSREAVKRRIKDGQIIIEGRPGTPRPNSKVRTGDVVRLTFPRLGQEDEQWNGSALPLTEAPTVVFEDEGLVVCGKPPFMSTHPTGRHLFHCATVFFETIHKRTIHSVHRLDRETSGVLLLGKNPKAAHLLTKEFEEDRVRKAYFFIAIPNDQYGGLREFWARERLASQAERGLERVIINAHPEKSECGKHASTFFQVLHKGQGWVMGLAFPQTGRQHQIRVHAKAHGLPLLGDKLYLGGYPLFQRFKDNLATPEDHVLMQIPRQALHALAINIAYQGERRTFVSPLPHDLHEWIEKHTPVQVAQLEIELEVYVEAYFKTAFK